MAEIRPFRAVRPSAEMASTVAALPYDVYSSDEAREIVKKNPKSFLAIDRAETQFEPGMSPYDDRVYEKAAQMLSDWTADGTFIRDGKPCFFLYELTMDGRSQTGIVGCASIDDYASGVIKKHENTRADKEEDRIRHVDACSAQTGPIFLAYRKNEAISEIVKNIKSNDTPLCDFVSDDGVRHRVFIIEKDDDIKNIAAAFAATENIYIADGHHRAASAVRVGFSRREKNPNFSGDEEFNYFLSVLFPDEELMIMDYNRVVKDLNGFTESEFLGEVRARFCVSRIGEMSCSGEVCKMLPPGTDEEIRPKNKGEFSMYLGGNWYLCKMRPGDVP
ncbi:MAG: DUF1015 domain-containing protein, partial [Clostridiales bacterium]|nr:DUF1015 domain-containing protein [Clostridiales bacterium]